MAELCSPTHPPQQLAQPSARHLTAAPKLAASTEEQAADHYKRKTRQPKQACTTSAQPQSETLAAIQQTIICKTDTPQTAQHRRSRQATRHTTRESRPACRNRAATTIFNLNKNALFQVFTWVLISTASLCLCTYHTTSHNILLPSLTPTTHSFNHPHNLKSHPTTLLPTSSPSPTHYKSTRLLNLTTSYSILYTKLSLHGLRRLLTQFINAPCAKSPPSPPTHPTITHHKVRKDTRTYHQTCLSNKQL